jgi:hypothetical protein
VTLKETIGIINGIDSIEIGFTGKFVGVSKGDRGSNGTWVVSEVKGDTHREAMGNRAARDGKRDSASSADGGVIDLINDETKAINGWKANDGRGGAFGSECNEVDEVTNKGSAYGVL